MNETKPNLTQPELPKPEEKLLRAPTFEEKHVWINKILFVALILLCSALAYLLMQGNTFRF